MKVLDSIKDDSIVICENDYKNSLLKLISENRLFLNVKFYTKNSFLKEYFFDWDEKTIYYLVDKYKYKVEVAKYYLNNLIYIEEKDYDNKKLKFLANLKKELDDNNLLIYNDNFKEIIKNKKIVIIGYPYLEPFEQNIFKSLDTVIIDEDNLYNHEVYEYETIEDEINSTCKKICELISKGISINKIKLVGITDEYYNDLERVCNNYNLPIKIPSNNNLYSNEIAKIFLDNISSSIEEGINAIKNYDEIIVNKIINICNKYIFDGDIKVKKELIINELKKTLIDNYNYANYLEIKNINSLFTDEYVFFLNFNNGNTPIPCKDEDYITDNIKDIVGLYNTFIVNKYNKEHLIKKIKSIKNLVLSYKLKNATGRCYHSSIINEINLNVIRKNNDITKSYSEKNDLINYIKCLDNYELYGEINPNIGIYKNTFPNTSYKSFDNKFKGISKDVLKDYLNNHLTLSYSSLSNYNKCSFRYYLANILKIDKYEESFEAFLGSLFHDVLEKCFTHNLIVEEEVSDYIKNNNKILTIKERFFVNKIINDIKFVINVLNRQQKYINLDKAYYEKNIRIDKSRDIVIEFTGYIDKILYKENGNESIIAIIDYKTGNVDIDLKYIQYGLGLQLPIYLYLVKKSNLFNNPKFVGFYLQYILDQDITRSNSISYEEQKYANLKLMGYSNIDTNLLKEFDSNYISSNLIKGMKMTNNGNFYSYSKVLSDKEINKVIDLTEESIDNAIDNICNGNFSINPKRIGYKNNVGCMYCRFSDICFHKDEDYITLDEVENLDFLKEGIYAEMD